MNILFLCTGNSCRSQMAEGYAKHLSEGIIEINSAGLEAHGINPRAIQVMKEDGIDISQQKSTQLTLDMLKWADLIITLCGHADEHCPIVPSGKLKRHLPFNDPAKASGTDEQILNEFRKIRDEIKEAIQGLIEEFTFQHKMKFPK